jgi:hypothetical protein
MPERLHQFRFDEHFQPTTPSLYRFNLKLSISDSINYNMFMAPFNTHFLIAEKIWPPIRAMVTWPAMYNQNYYGQLYCILLLGVFLPIHILPLPNFPHLCDRG